MAERRPRPSGSRAPLNNRKFVVTGPDLTGLAGCDQCCESDLHSRLKPAFQGSLRLATHDQEHETVASAVGEGSVAVHCAISCRMPGSIRVAQHAQRVPASDTVLPDHGSRTATCNSATGAANVMLSKDLS
jgi:hypothetical protein